MSAPLDTPIAPESSLPRSAATAAHAAVDSAVSATNAEESAQTDAPTEEGEAAAEDGPKADPTVFADASNFSLKHPLYSKWQLWFDSASKQDKAKSWDEALIKVVSFDSVEEFWGLYNNIVVPSLIAPNSNYYLFKEGIKPAWEDSANAKGGKWSVQLPRGKFSAEIDQYWLFTMLAAIGETFETPYTSAADAIPETPASAGPFSDEVTGVIVSARKAFYRINIWTRNSSEAQRAQIENIGRHFKYAVLGFDKGLKISEKDKVSSDVDFVSHKDSMSKSSRGGEKWSV